MRLLTTKKAIKNNGGIVLRLYYCEAQSLMRDLTSFAYSKGINGWACDYYSVNGVILSTGYSPIGTVLKSGLVKEYEEKARKLEDNYKIDYNERTEKRALLLNEFIEKAKIEVQECL